MRIVTEQAPSAKPVSISEVATTEWKTIIDVPDYDVPVVGFGAERRIAPGVAEISSPLIATNVTSASQRVSVRIIKSERLLASGQTQANFDGVSSNGTFSGGTGYSNGEVITLLNGATVTVTTVSSGVVTAFSLTTVGNKVPREGDEITSIPQFSSSSLGINFSLNAGESNFSNTTSTFILANESPVEINDVLIVPLNGQFLLTGDRLQVKGSSSDGLHVTLSYTEGQAEEDDLFDN
jgi:hypothetical protein